MLGNVKALRQNPAAAPYVMANLFQYAQARHMYQHGNFWEPQITAGAGVIVPRLREMREAAPALA